MTIECSDRKIRVIVVAGPGDMYRTDVLLLLDRLGIEYTLCPNIYAALGEIVCSSGNDKLIVVGPLEKLCRDQRRFFVITSEKDVKCCCIASLVFRSSLDQYDKPWLARIRRFISCASVMLKILARRLGGAVGGTVGSSGNRLSWAGNVDLLED